MGYTVFDEQYRKALDAVLRQNSDSIFLGTTGIQLTIASGVPGDEAVRIMSPAKTIEVHTQNSLPAAINGIDVIRTYSGAEALRQFRINYVLLGHEYPVASPEHLVGRKLSQANPSEKDRWECYALLAVLGNKGVGVNYETIRSFLKGRPKLEVLLKEWAYTLCG